MEFTNDSTLGVPLEELSRLHPHPVHCLPEFFVGWIKFIEDNIKQAKYVYSNESQENSQISDKSRPIRNLDTSVGHVASSLKDFVARVPQTVFSEALATVNDLSSDQPQIEAALSQISFYHFEMLAALFRHLRFVARHENYTEMSLPELCVIFSGSIKVNFDNFYMIAKNPQRFFPGEHCQSQISSLSLTNEAIESEIAYHEQFLNGIGDSDPEEACNIQKSLSFLRKQVLVDQTAVTSGKTSTVGVDEISGVFGEQFDILSTKLSQDINESKDFEEPPFNKEDVQDVKVYEKLTTWLIHKLYCERKENAVLRSFLQILQSNGHDSRFS